jgi:hypothetical protein
MNYSGVYAGVERKERGTIAAYNQLVLELDDGSEMAFPGSSDRLRMETEGLNVGDKIMVEAKDMWNWRVMKAGSDSFVSLSSRDDSKIRLKDGKIATPVAVASLSRTAKKLDYEAIREALEEAYEKVNEAAENMRFVARGVRGGGLGYDMSGNIEAYVINYLVDGVDCIADKIENYGKEIDQHEAEEGGEGVEADNEGEEGKEAGSTSRIRNADGGGGSTQPLYTATCPGGHTFEVTPGEVAMEGGVKCPNCGKKCEPKFKPKSIKERAGF